MGGLLIIFLEPMAAGLIRMAISRTREFSADATSPRTLGTAEPMIKALEKLDRVGKQIPLEAPPSMLHMYIMRPFSGTALSKLFSTHPSAEKRIAALQAWRRPPVDRNSSVIWFRSTVSGKVSGGCIRLNLKFTLEGHTRREKILIGSSRLPDPGGDRSGTRPPPRRRPGNQPPQMRW
jgi:hypothetical protein